MTTLPDDAITTATVPPGLLRTCLVGAVAGPVLLLVSSLIGMAAGGWSTWAVSGWAGGVQIVAMAGYALGFVGIALVLATRAFGLAHAVLVLGALVSTAGAGFGVDLIAAERFGERLPMPPDFAPGTALLAFTGVLFPVALVLAGIALHRARFAPPWLAAMIAVGGALFPAGRVPRPPMPALILTSDVLLLAGLVLLVARLWPGMPGTAASSSRP